MDTRRLLSKARLSCAREAALEATKPRYNYTSHPPNSVQQTAYVKRLIDNGQSVLIAVPDDASRQKLIDQGIPPENIVIPPYPPERWELEGKIVGTQTSTLYPEVSQMRKKKDPEFNHADAEAKLAALLKENATAPVKVTTVLGKTWSTGRPRYWACIRIQDAGRLRQPRASFREQTNAARVLAQSIPAYHRADIRLLFDRAQRSGAIRDLKDSEVAAELDADREPQLRVVMGD